MEGSRMDVLNWLMEHGETETPVSTITFFALNGLLDDCIVKRPPAGNKGRFIYDVEKAGNRILWIRQKQRINRLRINEIRELIKQGKRE